MPIDPSIVLGVQPSKPIDYLGAYGNALTLKSLMGQQQLQGLQLQQAQREADKQMRLSDLVRRSGGNLQMFEEGLMAEDPMAAIELGFKRRTQDATLAKLGAEGRKADMDAMGKRLEISSQIFSALGENPTPEQIMGGARYAVQNGLIDASAIPSDPAALPAWYQQKRAEGIAAEKQWAEQRAIEQRNFERQYPGEIGKLLYAQQQFRLAQDKEREVEVGDKAKATGDNAVTAPPLTLSMLATPFDAPLNRARYGDENKPFLRNDRGQIVPNEAAQKFELEASARRAPKITNVVGTQETETAKTIGKGVGEDYINIQRAEFASRRRVDRVSRLQNLLQDVDTGKLTPIGTQLAGYARSLGFDIDPKLGNKEAAIALENEIALELRNPSGGAGMPGAMSDSDRRFLQNMAAFTDKSPKGRALMVETLKRIADRDQQVAKMAREYMKRNGGVFDQGFYDELAVFGAANPLFPTQDQINKELEKRRR